MRMALEVSPRISFSHDLSQSDLAVAGGAAATGDRLDASLAADFDDFDFSTSCEISFQDPSPADVIFAGGKLLPLSSLPATHHPPVPPAAKAENLKDFLSSASAGREEPSFIINNNKRRPFWRFGRSSSVSSSSSSNRSNLLGSICPFPLARSKSTGSYLNPNTKSRQTCLAHNSTSTSTSTSNLLMFRKVPNDSKNPRYYYSKGSYGNGVRISPVLNVPAPFVPRGGSGGSRSGGGTNGTNLFTYLLCNCGDKNMEGLGRKEG